MFAVNGPLRGVNLGGWLVLERWMTPSVFEGTAAIDEYGLCEAGSEEAAKKLHNHRETFITEADFIWLKDHGIEAVRLPVGYWVFGDEPPFSGSIEYVDRAFGWAQSHSIKILLDLHGAPGSQNGYDHSGRAGKILWHKNEAHIIKTLSVVSRLAKRYAKHPALLGIELLNEPKWTVPRRKLLKYYEAAYKIVRAECGEDTWVVFHDSFRPRRWKNKLRGSQYSHMYIDTHHYQTFSNKDRRKDAVAHLQHALKDLPNKLRKMSSRHPVIVGEWSLTLDTNSLDGLDKTAVAHATRAYGATQLLAFQSTRAWFYWSYKTEYGGTWSFRECVKKGWLPKF